MFWTTEYIFSDMEQFGIAPHLAASAPLRAITFAEADAGAGAGEPDPDATRIDVSDGDGDQGPQPVDEAGIVVGLQEENQQPLAKIEQLTAAQGDAADAANRLDDAVEANEQLRNRYAQLALADAVRQAAEAVGVPADLAGVYSHRFTCRIDADGAAQIEPNPTEFLLARLKEDPLLQQSAVKAQQHRRASAVVSGVERVDGADPVELMAVLDRDAGKKARFIARHGTEAFVDLAERARRKGYRG